MLSCTVQLDILYALLLQYKSLLIMLQAIEFTIFLQFIVLNVLNEHQQHATNTAQKHSILQEVNISTQLYFDLHMSPS